MFETDSGSLKTQSVAVAALPLVAKNTSAMYAKLCQWAAEILRDAEEDHDGDAAKRSLHLEDAVSHLCSHRPRATFGTGKVCSIACIDYCAASNKKKLEMCSKQATRINN